MFTNQIKKYIHEKRRLEMLTEPEKVVSLQEQSHFDCADLIRRVC